MITPLNILYIVLSASVIIITVCVVWAFAYLIGTLRRIHEVEQKIVGTVDRVSNLVDSVREKITSSSAHIATLVELGAKAFQYVKERKKVAKQKKSTKKEVDFDD